MSKLKECHTGYHASHRNRKYISNPIQENIEALKEDSPAVLGYHGTVAALSEARTSVRKWFRSVAGFS